LCASSHPAPEIDDLSRLMRPVVLTQADIREPQLAKAAVASGFWLPLVAGEPVLPTIGHMSLASDSGFQDEFTNCMTFPEIDQV